MLGCSRERQQLAGSVVPGSSCGANPTPGCIQLGIRCIRLTAPEFGNGNSGLKLRPPRA